MEKRPFSTEKSVEAKELVTGKKQRRSPGEVVRDWLHYLETGGLEQRRHEEETDTSSEGKKKKKKNRAKRFLGVVLGREVAPSVPEKPEKVGASTPELPGQAAQTEPLAAEQMPGVKPVTYAAEAPWRQHQEQPNIYTDKKESTPPRAEGVERLRPTVPEASAQNETSSRPETAPTDIQEVPLDRVSDQIEEIPMSANQDSYTALEAPNANLHTRAAERLPLDEINRQEAIAREFVNEQPIKPVVSGSEAGMAMAAGAASLTPEHHARQTAANAIFPPNMTVVERGGNVVPAVAAFAGAEYMRRRDKKKHEKVHNSMQKRLDEIARVMESEKHASTAPTEVQRPDVPPRTEMPKPKEAAFVDPSGRAEATLPIPASVEGRTEPAPQAPERSSLSSSAGSSSERAPEARKASQPASVKEILQTMSGREKVPPVVNSELVHGKAYEKLAPETVLQQVEKAAEENVPLEGLFEHRHEIKDIDDPLLVHDSGAGDDPVTTVNSQGIQTPTIPPASGSSIVDARTKPPRSYAKDAGISPDQYHAAVANGFWTALILLVCLGLFLLIN